MARVNPVLLSALALWLTCAAPVQAAEIRLGFGTPDGQALPALQRGLFDAFFEGQLSYDAYARDIGDPSGPWAGGGLAVALEMGTRGPGGLHYRVALEAGQSRARFPDGIGIFTDPATIRVRYVAARAGVDLVHDYRLLARPALAMSVTAGLQASRASAHLSSALLDVRATATRTEPWLRAELEARPLRGVPGLRLTTALTAFPGGRTYLGFGTRLAF